MKKIKFLIIPLLFIAAVACHEEEPFPIEGEKTEDTQKPNEQQPTDDPTPADTDSTSTPIETDTTSIPVDTDSISIPVDDFDTIANQVFSDTIIITFNANSATITNQQIGVSTELNQAGNVVIRSSARNIVYLLSGNGNGSFKLYSEYKSSLILSDLELTCATGPTINHQGKKTLDIVLEGQSVLSDGANYATSLGEEDQKACLFSEGQILIGGSGTLCVNGNNKHAIASDDYIQVLGGQIKLASISDGLRTNDGIIIDAGSLTISSGDNALQCDNNNISINGGVIHIQNNGETSKGIKAYGDVNINNGEIHIVTAGKGIHTTNGNIAINNGELIIQTTYCNGKGLHASIGEINIAGGYIDITTSGNPATINNDTKYAKGIKANGNITISGGHTVVCVTGKSSSSSSNNRPGSNSMSNVEGIESKASIIITGGELEVTATDDAINAATNFDVSGGKIYACSSGNDAIDSNGSIYISGGIIVAIGASGAEEGIDTDNNTMFHLTGGTIVAMGGSAISPGGNTTTQYNLQFSGASNTSYNISNASNSEVMNFKTPSLSYTPKIFATSPLMTSGSHTINKGVSITDGEQWHGLYLSATHSGGTSSSTVNASLTSANSGPGGGTRPW